MDLLPPATALAKQNIPFDYNPQHEILFPVRLDGRPVTALLDTGAVQTGQLECRSPIWYPSRYSRA